MHIVIQHYEKSLYKNRTKQDSMKKANHQEQAYHHRRHRRIISAALEEFDGQDQETSA